MEQPYCAVCDHHYSEAAEAQDLADCPTCGEPLETWTPAAVPRHPRRGVFMHGVYVVLFLHSIQLLWLMDPTGWVWIWFTGITQVVYVVPAAIVMLVQGKFRTLGGLLAAAVATALLNFMLAGLLCGGTLY